MRCVEHMSNLYTIKGNVYTFNTKGNINVIIASIYVSESVSVTNGTLKMRFSNIYNKGHGCIPLVCFYLQRPKIPVSE